ncbi:MAG: hypothetical protein J6M18_05005 [Actinomycetaceae bacterium]|nr:hypothetical protein [Actinomycetaceae bacterium]
MGTIYLARCLFFISALYWGIALYGSFMVRGIASTLFLSLHAPFEIVAWLSVMCASRIMLRLYRKEKFQKNIRLLFFSWSMAIMFYLVAAWIESYVAGAT